MDNTSLDNQRLKGIDYCIQNGFKYEVFNDVISGSKINRDGLDLLFQKVYDKEISGIILYRWDRLQRQNRFIPNSTLSDVYKKEGLRFFWKGNGALCYRRKSRKTEPPMER